MFLSAAQFRASPGEPVARVAWQQHLYARLLPRWALLLLRAIALRFLSGFVVPVNAGFLSLKGFTSPAVDSAVLSVSFCQMRQSVL